ncbi:hypothetical protein ACTXM3_15990 [Glutamicibacter arilaitensis]
MTLLLKAPAQQGGLFKDLNGISDLEIIDDFSTKRASGARYSQRNAAQRIEEIVDERQIDVVICRGFAVCKEVSKLPHAGSRLWAYMTDIPQTAEEMTDDIRADLTSIATMARRMFAQTNEARDFLEYHVPAARGKTLVLYPMLPDTPASVAEVIENKRPPSLNTPIRLVYAGKFARAWKTLEMCEIPARAAELGINVELTMIGDKIQNDVSDPTWANRMRAKINESSGVTWLGRMSRQETMRELSKHDIGLAWRSSELDGSHEISTKLLEYLACGVQPLLNRTAMHETLLDAAYPLFIDNGEVLEALQKVRSERLDLAELRRVTEPRINMFRVNVRSDYLETELERATRRDSGTERKISLNVVGDQQFTNSMKSVFGELLQVIADAPETTVDAKVDGMLSHFTVVEGNSLTKYLTAGQPVWATWSRKTMPVPNGVNLAGVLIQEPGERLRAARWADIPVRRVFVIPRAVDHTARRAKTKAAKYTVGVVVGPGGEGQAVAGAHQLLKELLNVDSRFNIKLLFPAEGSTPLDTWEQEIVLDGLSKLSRDDETACSWSMEPLGGAGAWLREVGWIIGSKDNSVELQFGDTPRISNTIELPSFQSISGLHITKLAAPYEALVDQITLETRIADGHGVSDRSTDDDREVTWQEYGELDKVLAAVSV